MLVHPEYAEDSQGYFRPKSNGTLTGQHPIQEKFVTKDTYAAQQSRFQRITDCNMSDKSTYIRPSL